MANKKKAILDGNEAAASVAYRMSEVIAIYPITPSSNMGELSDQWASEKKPNLWGAIPTVVEMQSEGGASGAVHGALQAGALSTTFTSSQGLLLMIPNMYKIAGELTSAVFHVAARTVATQALSIFGDHSDVMATRATGFALLASGSIQEVIDLGMIAHTATLESRVPFLHFFDGFRTSHEAANVYPLANEEMRAMVDDKLVLEHRARALSPDHPVIRGTAHNPDVHFQSREAINPTYIACPTLVEGVMDRFAKVTGRRYNLFDYVGAPDAERVIVLMGSGADAVHETVEYLAAKGEKIGVLKVRLYRPFSASHFLAALPKTVKVLGVLDRTKEPGSLGEPLYLDVVTAVSEAFTAGKAPWAKPPKIVGGRYGLSSKEFTPAMIRGVFDEMKAPEPRNHFTVGIVDDVTHTSLPFDPSFSPEPPETLRAVFFGLGADGTVGANKNSVKIIGDQTDLNVQGYFVYDSKKSGSITISHLRFGPKPIRSPYLIDTAGFVGCHQFTFVQKLDMLKLAAPGAVFLLNSPYGPDQIWDKLPRVTQRHLIEKKMRFYVIDAYKLAEETGMGSRINTIMQACFFAISGVLPREQAVAAIKKAIEKTYGRLGEAVVKKNIAAVDGAVGRMVEVKVPGKVTSTVDLKPPVPKEAPEFVRNVSGRIIANEGDSLPVSALPPDGTWPSATTRWEKRGIALEIPILNESLCIQCGKCVLVCPHAAIRAKVYEPKLLAGAPTGFSSVAAKWPGAGERRYTLQVAPEDCTGCTLCVEVCPAKDKTDPTKKALVMEPLVDHLEEERAKWDFFLALPDPDRSPLNIDMVKDVQLLAPTFEFSGACAGCGETPYVKLMSQLFGDRSLVANATGCSSIYGGNLPTTPWAIDKNGRGPAWSNSLFEDNAEFGLGMRLALDAQAQRSRDLLGRLASQVGEDLAGSILKTDQSNEAGIKTQRDLVVKLREKLLGNDSPDAKELHALADALVRKSVWVIGGDGWAYDIGYGGLDHVLASGKAVKMLVLDTEVYSNTGGQMSKATPRGAVAKFAAGGKPLAKKDLALMAIPYGQVYVARVAFGANDAQTLKAFREAEAYDGPALIIAYSHCIAHSYDLERGLDQQKAAVLSGYWPLFRFDPRLAQQGKNPLRLDSKAPSLPLKDYVYKEARYTMLLKTDPEGAARLLKLAEEDVQARWKLYEHLAAMSYAPAAKPPETVGAGATGGAGKIS